jgi:hypothetical protein
MFWFLLHSKRGIVIVRFVDIGGIVDHHCLNYLFIIYKYKMEILKQIRRMKFYIFSLDTNNRIINNDVTWVILLHLSLYCVSNIIGAAVVMIVW